MVGPEQGLREAVVSAWKAFNSNAERCKYIHEDCAVVILEGNGAYSTGKATLFDWPRKILKLRLCVVSVKASTVGKQSSSYLQVCLGEDRQYSGYFVLLKEPEEESTSWKCISITLTPKSSESILPKSYHEINVLTWDGYCHANKICDGRLMASYFHGTCRLTYTGPSDCIVICNSKDFYSKVSGRYETEEIHKPYAHLKNDPRLDDYNTMISIEFAGPQLAMVILKVGHPPFLWTDMLTCARIRENGETKWWIMHKSSDSEPHPLSHLAKV